MDARFPAADTRLIVVVPVASQLLAMTAVAGPPRQPEIMDEHAHDVGHFSLDQRQGQRDIYDSTKLLVLLPAGTRLMTGFTIHPAWILLLTKPSGQDVRSALHHPYTLSS